MTPGGAKADLALIVEAVREAGRISDRFTGPEARRWDKADGAGPVTEADLAIDRYLKQALCASRPDYGWLSEETEDDAARLSRNAAFIVDPIDGTRNFVEGGRTWAISVAVAHHGQVTAGAIFLPRRDKLYAAALGAGASLNGRPLALPPAGPDLDSARILAAKPTLRAHHWRARTPQFERHYRPSLAYRLALVAEGRFDGMLALRRTWEWDIAAGSLLVAEAGGRVSTRTGEALGFNRPGAQLDGVVAAAPVPHAQLLSALAIPAG